MQDYDSVESSIAVLAADDDVDGVTVSGVAIGVEDETKGMSGKRTVWPAETLREAEGLLSGAPITKGTPESEHHPGARKTEDGVEVDPQPPVDSVIGEVTNDSFVQGVGLVWEGRLTDEALAEKVEAGLVDVSPVVARDIESRGDGTDTFEATQIHGFRDLTVVTQGAAPSNSIEPGAAAAMSEFEIAALASDTFGYDALKTVGGVAFQGTATGKLDESAIPNDDYEAHYIFDADTKTDSSYPVVDADGNLRRGNVDSAWQERGHAPDEGKLVEVLQDLNGEFDDPPIDESELNEALAGDDPSGASTSARNANQGGSMSEDLTETEQRLLMEANDIDDPTVVSEAQTDLLREAEGIDSPTVVDSAEFEALQERVDDVRDVMEDALQQRTDLKESTVEALDFGALCAEFEDENGNLDAEALVQTPETGDPGEEDFDNTDDAEVEALVDEVGASDRDEAVELLRTRYENFSEAGWEAQAQDVKERLETLGAEVN